MIIFEPTCAIARWALMHHFPSRHGYEARRHEAEAKPKPLLNHEAEAEAEALTFWKHEAEAEAEAFTFLKSEAEAEAEAQMLSSYFEAFMKLLS